MENSILARILALKTASLPELQKEYEAVFDTSTELGINPERSRRVDGKKAPSNNKTYLWQRIAYRIQELEYGGLPEEAKNKVKGLAKEYDPINNKALRPNNTNDGADKHCISRDRRLPMPGTLITKNYKGTDIRVKILEKDFEYNGKIYRTLTAIAKEVTGSHWNGFLFFSL